MDSIYPILQKAHSGWAYIVLIALLIASINAISGKISKRPFKHSDRQLSLFALIASHIQLLIGLLVYFVSPFGSQSLGVMKGVQRVTSIEHPLLNIIALVLITVGWSLHKKRTDDTKKFQVIGTCYGIGLLLIAVRIPYELWFK